MKTESEKIAVCICTYKRPQLLRRLLDDIAAQERRPSFLIVVDGDPESGEVYKLLEGFEMTGSRIFYQPSNHANLAYQRYLGWKIAHHLRAGILIYFDDDLRLHSSKAVSRLAEVLEQDACIVAATASMRFGSPEKMSGQRLLQERGTGKHSWVRYFWGAHSLPAGGLTSYGTRSVPEPSAEPFQEVEWLRGGVMAFRMSGLEQRCFSEDLFAMNHIGCGLGEDTLLARRVRHKGKLVLLQHLDIEHPHDDLPKAYPVHPFAFGFSSAYSRRLLNDNFRGFAPPRLSDRWALLKSFFGNFLISWGKALLSFRKDRILFALGYSKGVFWGLLKSPKARTLTPSMRWWEDADKDFAEHVEIREGTLRAG